MRREDAARLVPKLRALAADKAATPGEARLAREKADALVARYNLGVEEVRRSAPRRGRRRRARPAPPADWAFWSIPNWDFDLQTGRASKNVKVHHYHDSRNWKIEIDLKPPDLKPPSEPTSRRPRKGQRI